MTTLLTNPRQIKTEDSHTKNVLKNKQDNQTNRKVQSKNANSQEKHNSNLKKSVEKTQIQQNQILAQKKGNKIGAEQNNNLRNIIQNHQEQYKQPKPFNKKYGTQNTHFKNPPTPPLPQLKQQLKPLNNQIAVKNKTRQSFNKKLISNIIKDQEKPNSKHSYRIKKVENHRSVGDARSPKKIRDDLIALNEEEYKLQMEILQIHKSTKQQLQEYKQTYHFNMNNHKRYFPQVNLQEVDQEHFLLQIAEKFKQKQKEIAKIQAKVQSNAYLQYFNNLPEDIMELHSSQEQDEVEQLPQNNRPRLQNNMGSYSTSMASFKDKKHGLNLRRTYDVFKQDEKQSRITHQQIDQMNKQENIKEDGQNKMTVNSKLKDFLLS